MAGHHGVVYTRAWVAELVLDLAGYTSDLPLWRKVVVEPACGQGSFVRPIVERLIESAIRAGRFDSETLQDSVICYELNPDSVAVCRGLVQEILISHGMSARDGATLSARWIRHGDYLLSELTPCDYVIGNPPYLRATEIPTPLKARYCEKLQAMTRGCDLFVGFIEQGLRSLRDEHGVLGFICADRWLQNQYGSKLRELISNRYHLDTVIRMHGVAAFDTEVSSYPAITLIDKQKGSLRYADCKSTFCSQDVGALKSWLKSDQSACTAEHFSGVKLDSPQGSAVIPLSDPLKIKNLFSLRDRFPSLEDSGVTIGIGLATGKDAVYLVQSADLVERERMLPMFNMRDWRRSGNTDANWLVNPWDRDGSLVDLADFPRLKSYFETHKADLAGRYVARQNLKAWYRTIDKVNWQILGKPMLLFPDLASSADPVYSDGTRYPCHNCYYLVSDLWDLRVLGGLLMSNIAESFIDALGVKMRGGTKRFQAQYLRLIHVPSPADIPAALAAELKTAFVRQDRAAANRAALVAYGLEGR